LEYLTLLADSRQSSQYIVSTGNREMTDGMVQDDPQASNGRDKLGRFVAGVSGNPRGHVLSRHYRELYAELAAELGGDESLTAIDRALLGQVCGLVVRARCARSDNAAVRLANAASRLLANLQDKRHKREAKGPTLAEYVAGRKSAEVAR
jgi:hypothetical protein